MQSAGAASYNVVQLIVGSSVETQAVVAICVVFSLVSWYVIGAKWWELHELRGRAARLRRRAQGHPHAGRAGTRLSGLGPSPYAELLRSTSSFIADLRASMQRDGVARTGFSLTQLEALTMTLESGAGESVARAGRMIPLLAIVAATSPLLGLFGTVLGIMRAFLGIANGGTSADQRGCPGHCRGADCDSGRSRSGHSRGDCLQRLYGTRRPPRKRAGAAGAGDDRRTWARGAALRWRNSASSVDAAGGTRSTPRSTSSTSST